LNCLSQTIRKSSPSFISPSHKDRSEALDDDLLVDTDDEGTEDRTEDRTDNLARPNGVYDPNATPWLWLNEDFDEPFPKKLLLSDHLKQFSDHDSPNYQVCLLIFETFQSVIEKNHRNNGYRCAYEKDLPRFLCWLNSPRVLHLTTTVL
jgi:hypothetical protein